MLLWDPLTVKLELSDELGGPPPSKSFNKLMAAVRIVTSDVFYRSLPDFVELCNALYNGTISPHTFDPADAAEIAWGITEALLLWPPDPNDENPFSKEIVEYIKKALQAEGILQPPDILRLGMGDGTKWDKVQSEFSDDPSMFNAIHDIEQSKADEIDAVVRARLRNMLQWLPRLPLRTGDTSDAAKRMLNALGMAREENRELKPV